MRFISGFLLTLVVAVPLYGKSLFWDSMEVRARLDAEGRLHVVERQAMVFDGDWNGGERTFRLDSRQKIRLESLTRIDPRTGEAVALRKGDLDEVDEFKWTDERTLRWRSRLPSDPPFESETIIYELVYTMRNVLVHRDGNDFVLDHEFAFPDRDGVIERFHLSLEIDSVWETRQRNEAIERENLAPGQEVSVNVPMRWTGEGDPPGIVRPAPWWLRAVTACVIVALAILGLRGLVERERKRGRFAPLRSPETIDRNWLEENLFSIPPEVVGATWDRTVASPEVAAMLARLVSERKLKSWTEKRSGFLSSTDVLHLELLAGRDELGPAERPLIDALFPDRRTVTSTDIVKEHYRDTGFSPASKIRSHLQEAEAKLFTRATDKEIPRALDTRLILLLLVVAFGGLAGNALMAPESGPMLVLLSFGLSLVSMFVAIPAGLAKERVENVPLWIGAPAAMLSFILVAGALASTFIPMTLTAALALQALTLFWFLVGMRIMGTASSRSQIELRKRLAAARRILEYELRREKPRLEDDWFPWILAFGLGPHVDRWFSSFGGASVSDRSAAIASSGLASSGHSSSGGWSGGGGAFGGAGATGSWVMAATAMSSGVSAPSSSSGGSSGGGGGGSSSGGGGGGGW